MTTVSYSDFHSQTQVLTADGGPWTAQVSHPDIKCTTIQWYWCGKCIQCHQPLRAGWQTSYKVVLFANISVPIDKDNRPKSLTFGFSYRVGWSAFQVYPGIELTSGMYVGDDSYLQNFQSYPFDEFYNTPEVLGYTISRWGTTSIEDDGSSIAYVPLRIALTFPGAQLVYYIMKDVSLSITSPVGSDGSFIGSLPSSSSSSSSPSSSTTPADPTPQVPVHESNQPKVQAGVIVGVVFAVIVCIVFALIIFIRRRRRKRALTEGVDVNPSAAAGLDDEVVILHTDPTTSARRPHEPSTSTISPWIIPSSPTPSDRLQLTKPLPFILPEESQRQQQQVRDMSETSSIITRLPAYDPERTQARSPPPWSPNSLVNVGTSMAHRAMAGPDETAEETGLAGWARRHRAQIPARLEAKLASAGYVPTDNPNSISEEEWLREYGVTKFELSRIQALYHNR